MQNSDFPQQLGVPGLGDPTIRVIAHGDMICIHVYMGVSQNQGNLLWGSKKTIVLGSPQFGKLP